MTFEDSAPAARYLTEGYRPELEYVPARRETTEVVTSSPPADGDAAAAVAPVPTPNLDYVFDDPADGEPGRDRVVVHGVWELVLALGLAGLGYVLFQADGSVLEGEGLRRLLLAATIIGLLASAVAISLRAGVPNLAVGAVAVAASVYFGQHVGDGLRTTLLVVLGLAAAIGLVQGLIVVGLHVPAWAVGLGALLALTGWLAGQRVVTVDTYDAVPDGYLWFGAFCAVSLIASAVGLVPVIRRGFGRFRSVADPARRRGTVAAAIAVAATVVSALLGAGAGLLVVFVEGRANPGGVLDLTAVAVGAALLGGTSAFGRRGGIFGTIFASALLAIAAAYLVVTERDWPLVGLGAAALGLGLVATRLIERFGRPRLAPAKETDAWEPKVHAVTPAARSWQPAATPTPAGGLWASDDAWGSTSDLR